jgi:DNA-binding YbaB/EbfC family protein
VTDDAPSLADVIRHAKDMQQHLLLAQAELAKTEVTGSAGGGQVTVVMRGTGEVSGITFDQAAIDEGDPEALAALTLTALHHATDAVKSLTTERMAAVTNGLGEAFGQPRYQPR